MVIGTCGGRANRDSARFDPKFLEDEPDWVKAQLRGRGQTDDVQQRAIVDGAGASGMPSATHTNHQQHTPAHQNAYQNVQTISGPAGRPTLLQVRAHRAVQVYD